MTRLKDKIAIVTGAAQGMGAAIAENFVKEGAHVIICDILEKKGEALATELGEQATFARLDVSSEENWHSVVTNIIGRHGKIDILVNNAGILRFHKSEDTSVELFQQILNINLVGAHIGIVSVVPHMKKAGQGSIINMSSADGLDGANGLSAYGASKWGLRGLTKVTALEFGPHNIRVNSIHPGGINTAMVNPQGVPSEYINQGFKIYPAQRVGEVDEVASAAVYLASDESTYCMGSEIAVDGGMTAGHYYMTMPGAPEI